MGLGFAEDSCVRQLNLRIVLLGKTGSGKSESGNTILGVDSFTAIFSPSSVTKTCTKQTAHLDDRSVSVIDTPGIFDTSTEEGKLKDEIENCIMLSIPGPHVFLLVVRLDVRFTEEERKAVQWIKDNFGEEAAKYTMVLFTRGDMLKETSLKKYLEQSPELTKLVSDCKAGYIVFDNTCKANRTQVADLFEKIDKTVHENGNHYTSEVYDEAQRKLKREQWWHNCDDILMAGTAAAAAVATAAPCPVRRVVTAASLLMATGAMVAKFFRR